MTLKKQLKINGMCEKLTLSEDGTKMFYVDRNKNDIWAIELDNNYLLKISEVFLIFQNCLCEWQNLHYQPNSEQISNC